MVVVVVASVENVERCLGVRGVRAVEFEVQDESFFFFFLPFTRCKVYDTEV